MKCCPLLPWRSVPRDKCRDGDLFCSSNHSAFLHFQGVVPAFCLVQGFKSQNLEGKAVGRVGTYLRHAGVQLEGHNKGGHRAAVTSAQQL